MSIRRLLVRREDEKPLEGVMEFMLLIVDRNDAARGSALGTAEVEKVAGELARQGKLKGGGPLHPPARGARVQVRHGKVTVTDGPPAGSTEVIGGAFIVEAASRPEAIAIAERSAHAAGRGILEVRLAPDRDVTKPGEGSRFMFLLHQAPDESDPDRSKYREMVAYDEALKREGRYVESSQLALDPPAARIESRAGRVVVTDGPFAETKELAGGYYVVEAASRSEAVELAARCPHAKWGSVEVREVKEVGPR
jgi:hypothetical protein